jgi:hypothetical protein
MPGLNLNAAVLLLQSLVSFVEVQRTNFKELEAKVMATCVATTAIEKPRDTSEDEKVSEIWTRAIQLMLIVLPPKDRFKSEP